MDRDQSVEDVESDVDGFAVAEVLLAGCVVTQGLAVDVLGDEIPVAGAGLAGPEDLDDVRVVDLAERADLATDSFVAGGVVEELEGPLLALDLVADPVDLREAALAEDVEDLEPPVDHVADGVVGGLGADRRLHLCRVGLGQHLAVAGLRVCGSSRSLSARSRCWSDSSQYTTRLGPLADAVAEVDLAELGGADERLLLLHAPPQLQRELGCPGQRLVGHLHLGVRPQQLQQAVDRVVGGLAVAAAELASPLEAALGDIEPRGSAELAPALGEEVADEPEVAR